MKKLSLLLVACFCTAISLSAAPEKYFFMYMEGYEDNLLSGWFIIDRETMSYIPESDSEVKNQIKNYKKSGNKETFEVWEDSYYVMRAELVIADGKKTITYFHKGEQGEEKQPTQIIGTEEEWEAEYEKKYGKKPSGGSDDGGSANPVDKAKGNAVDKVTGGVKNAFNKTKDLFKKKDK